MKDESPRIFRNLEMSVGRDGFDTIVGAAVASYGSLRSPSENQARDFARLVVPLWDKITPETRRSLAASLSNSPRVAREIVERLVAEPIEVSAPFLMSSPALGEAELKVLGLSRDRRVRKIIAGRGKPASAKAAEARATASAGRRAAPAAAPAGPVEPPTAIAAPDASVARSPDAPAAALGATPPPAAAEASLPPRTVQAPPLVPDIASNAGPRREEAAAEPPAPARTPASLVRETLRRLALPGGRRQTAAPGTAPSLRELVTIAVQQDADRFYDGLGRMLSVPAETLRQIEADESGERLAVAIKALDARPADALTILMMMNPRIGLDVAAFERMTKYYRALKPEDCAALTRGLARRPAVAAPALQPQYQDLAPLPRTDPRPAFGRRKTLPGEEEKGLKRG